MNDKTFGWDLPPGCSDNDPYFGDFEDEEMNEKNEDFIQEYLLSQEE